MTEVEQLRADLAAALDALEDIAYLCAGQMGGRIAAGVLAQLERRTAK